MIDLTWADRPTTDGLWVAAAVEAHDAPLIALHHHPKETRMTRPSALPPALQWPRQTPVDLDALRDEEARLTAQAHAVSAQVRAAQNACAAAPEQDRLAYAQALRHSTPQPKVTAQQTADAALAKAQADMAGVGEALWQVRDEIVQTVTRLRPQWSKDMHARIDQARDDYAQSVQTTIQARDTLTRCVVESEWLDRFPERPQITMRSPNVDGLIGRNGTTMLWPTVAAALTDEAQTLYRPPVPDPPYDVAQDMRVMRERDGDDDLLIQAIRNGALG